MLVMSEHLVNNALLVVPVSVQVTTHHFQSWPAIDTAQGSGKDFKAGAEVACVQCFQFDRVAHAW